MSKDDIQSPALTSEQKQQTRNDSELTPDAIRRAAEELDELRRRHYLPQENRIALTLAAPSLWLLGTSGFLSAYEALQQAPDPRSLAAVTIAGLFGSACWGLAAPMTKNLVMAVIMDVRRDITFANQLNGRLDRDRAVRSRALKNRQATARHAEVLET